MEKAAPKRKRIRPSRKRKITEVVKVESPRHVRHSTPKGVETGDLQNSIQHIMFGYGDTCPSDPDSVGLMEQLVMDHIGRLTHRVAKVSNTRGKLDSECVLFLFRPGGEERVKLESLLTAHDIMRTATSSGFDPTDGA